MKYIFVLVKQRYSIKKQISIRQVIKKKIRPTAEKDKKGGSNLPKKGCPLSAVGGGGGIKFPDLFFGRKIPFFDLTPNQP